MKQLTVIFLTVFFISCKTNNQYKTWLANPQTYSNTVYALNSIVVDNNFPPMIASRNYAYTNIAAYEVLAAAYPGQYQSLAGQLKGLSQLKQPDTTNVNYELAALLAFIKLGEAVTFPAGSMEEYKTQLIKTATDKGLPGNVNKASQQFADSIANQIIKWSKGDNYLATRGSIKYTVLDVPGRWIPTPPGYTTAVEPNWNKIRPMVMDSAAQFMPPRPPAFDVKNKNSTYYKALLEVKNIGDSITDEQKHIAEFWDDNPFKQNVVGHVQYVTKKFSPPGHWMNITGIAAKAANVNFIQTVAAYTQTSIALFDAFISCWDEKYRSNYIRPETEINKIFPDWRPYIQTPPFPSHTSGHSTITAAAAQVMIKHFGNNLSFTDTSLLQFGIKSRPVTSFTQAAQEASISRVYGGIHYRFDCDMGNQMGTKIGELIVGKLKMKK
jgi:hypothetical protein